MVQGNIGDDGHQWSNDIGCIEPPSHADLQHDKIHLFFGKIKKSEGRGEFEIGNLPIPENPPDAGGMPGKGLFADIAVVDFESFPTEERWGEVYQPTLYPARARTSTRAAPTDPLPLVPAMWI